MTVTVQITITKDEANEYCESWKEFNSNDLAEDDIKKHFIEQFWADKHEYLCLADIACEII